MSDWPCVSLADVAEIRFSNVDKKTVAGESPALLCNYMDVYGNGGYITENIPFMQASVSDAEVARFAVKQGDVLITKDSETPDDIGIPAVVLDDIPGLVCGYHLALIKPNKARIHPLYLAKQFANNEARAYFSRLANGSTRYGLSSSAIAKVAIRLAPLVQQKQIAEILFTIDDAIEQTESLIAKYQNIKAGLMHDLFTRGVTPDGRLRPTHEQAPELYKKSPLGWIPKEWGVSSLSEYLVLNDGIKPGPFGSSLTKDIYQQSGYRVYGQEQVIADDLSIGNYYITSSKFAEMRGFEILDGDVLMSLVGTVGRVLVVQGPFEPGIINPRLMRLRPNKAIAMPGFIRLLLLSSSVQRQIEVLSGGGTMPVINGKVIKRLLVPKLEIEEQKLVVDRLMAIESTLASFAETHKKLSLQKQGLMHDLLTGRVRVKNPQAVQ